MARQSVIMTLRIDTAYEYTAVQSRRTYHPEALFVNRFCATSAPNVPIEASISRTMAEKSTANM
ncbi:hypothetical protein IWW51_006632, partial [Coemansia sp. RSA 2702]